MYDTPYQDKSPAYSEALETDLTLTGYPNADNSSPNSPAMSNPSGFAMAFPKESAISVGCVTAKNIPSEQLLCPTARQQRPDDAIALVSRTNRDSAQADRGIA